MFLKRIEMQGFKSFADRTVITFDNAITGIVGPNGCGKSNISDAIRWVLGEQSAKSMRGEKMNDVIFAGSADRHKLNMAEVTLVFDNSSHVLNSDLDEVEVTRKLFRDSGDAEYLINHKNVRLKDVVDLFLDTGLGRDSLSIISQGNIVSFAEAKPLERRGIFEEAAGVAKYKKRRMESLSSLDRTKSNLDRCSDILAELEKQVSPLKRQARKAQIYREKKERLKQIEISVLVQEIDEINADIDSAKKTLLDIEARTAMYNASIQVTDTRIKDTRDRSAQLDKRITSLQDELMKLMEEIHQLESRRTELDEKSKYLIQSGSNEVKYRETKKLMEDARIEYEDRQKRLSQLNRDMDLCREKGRNIAQNLSDARMQAESEAGVERSLENRKAVLDQLLRNPFNNQGGIRSIMDHQNALHGILGVIGQVLKADSGYEEAISTALGGALNNIVTKDEQSARDAIRFLTRNQSGRATFLPLTVCRPRWVAKDVLIICENVKGYLGTASDFVTNEPIFDPVVQSLLNNVLVCDSMEAGNELSALTKRQYKIVTLNGEVIHKGGSMTGGKARHSANIMTIRHEAEEIDKKLASQRAKAELAEKNLAKMQAEKQKNDSAYSELKIAGASLEPVVDAKKAKYEKLKNELALLKPADEKDEDAADQEQELIVRLNKAYSRRDDITTEIKTDRESRIQLNAEAERKETQLRQLRSDCAKAEASANAIKVDQGKLETKLETDLQRLASEYQLTYEYAKANKVDAEIEDLKQARSEVAKLRSDIEHLGNVNMDAPEQYKEINTRYEQMKQQIEELTASRDKILAAIDEMDTVMKKQFRETFDAINKEFDVIFRNLYGGGRAELVLQDPDDLLNTGIDINAQPPGKNVQNNMLFSGGEKSLIALCVLFAILKVKPVPLVILDEVEAALDPGNVERFAQYLHKYTDRTQFLVVTHRVGTMEKCDVLYGVTMQHQGVSQMLRVNLKEAMDLAEPDKEDV